MQKFKSQQIKQQSNKDIYRIKYNDFNIVIFKISRPKSLQMGEFIPNKDFKKVNFGLANTAVELTEQLRQTIINEDIIQDFILNSGENDINIIYHDGNKLNIQINEYQPQHKQTIIKKYLNSVRDRLEILSRDNEIFNDFAKIETIYAVVLLNKNLEYRGHVYSCISNLHGICFVRGIRNTILSNIYKSYNHKDVNNLSTYIFVGVNILAKIHGCTQIYVPSPLPVMKTILTKMGFEIQIISNEILQPISCSDFFVGSVGNSIVYFKNVE